MRLPYMLGLILGLRLLSARSLSGFVAWGAVIFAAIFKGGSQHPLRWTLFGIGRPKMAFSGRGTVDGFAEVERVFRGHFEAGLECGAQCVVYHRGEPVVDLCGSSTGSAYGPDTLQNVFSSTKVIESIVVAMLVDRGLIDYEQKISTVWPEFGCNGKDELRIVDLLKHESGLSNLDHALPLADLTAARIRQHAVSATIANQQARGVGERRYHALTRGWVVNEIVVRVDPKQRTIGQFVRDEIAMPLGIERDVYIGLPPSEDPRVSPLKSTPLLWTLVQSVVPKILGRQLELNLLVLIAMRVFGLWLPKLKRLVKGLPPAPPAFTPSLSPFVASFNEPLTRRAEIPSANGHANARAMAKIGAAVSAALNSRCARLRARPCSAPVSAWCAVLDCDVLRVQHD